MGFADVVCSGGVLVRLVGWGGNRWRWDGYVDGDSIES